MSDVVESIWQRPELDFGATRRGAPVERALLIADPKLRKPVLTRLLGQKSIRPDSARL
jgi:hypothetical protein